MPKVVIELQANTQQAVQQIQQFARAQKDAFDAVKAGNPALADAHVKVSKLSDANKDATKSTSDWQRSLSVLPGTLGQVASQVTTLLGALRGPAGLAVALVGTGVAMGKLAASLGNDIERLKNLATQTDLSVAALQAFEAQARASGEAPEQLARGLGKVNDAIAAVILGKPGMTETFTAIGVDLEKMVKHGADSAQVLEALAVAFAKMPDPTKQAALQVELFGTKTKATQVVMEDLARLGMQGLIDKWRELGAVTSEETNRAAMKVDEMADRFDAGVAKIIKKTKQYAAEFILDIINIGKITKDIFTLGPEKAAENLKKALEGVPPAVEAAIPPMRTLGGETEKAAKAAKDAADAAKKLKDEIAELGSTSLDIFKSLGPGFEDVVKKLEVAQFVEKSQKAIDTLTRAMDLGLDTTGRYAAGIEALKTKMQEAVTLGYVPTEEAAKKTTEAVEKLGTVTEDTRSNIEKMFGVASGPLFDALDRLIGKANAAQAALAGTTGVPALDRGPTYGFGQGPAGPSGPTGIPALDAPASAGVGRGSGGALNPQESAAWQRYAPISLAPEAGGPSAPSLRTSSASNPNPSSNAGYKPQPVIITNWQEFEPIPSFQHGGVVPGSGPVPIIAHGGEVVVPTQPGRAMARGGGTTVVRIEPGAVQVSGTVIEQSRGWAVLVEELGQALEARLR